MGEYSLTCLDLNDGTPYSVGRADGETSEKAVENHYRSRSYTVMNLNKFKTEEDLAEMFGREFVERFNRCGVYDFCDLLCRGVPDLLVYNSVGDWFMFVEVKSVGDGLRKSQLDWVKVHAESVPVQVIWVENVEGSRREFDVSQQE